MRSELLVPLLLVSALTFGVKGATTNINLGIMWDVADVAGITQSLFQRIFLPNLTRSCSAVPGFNDTRFNFIDLPQVGLMNISLLNAQIDQLKRSNCLFVGGYRSSSMQAFSSASIPSGVAGFPSMTLHDFAPLTLITAIDGVLAAVSKAFNFADHFSAREKLAIVLGTGYSLEEMQALIRRFPGSVEFYQLETGNEQYILRTVKAAKITNFFVASTASEADEFLSAAFDSLLLAPSYRWFLFNVMASKVNNIARLVDRTDFSGFRVVSKNITSMEFGHISTAIENNLTRPLEMYNYDLLSIWSIYLKKIVCKDPNDVNQTFTGVTGDFRLLPNGTVQRLNWRMYFYGGLGNERARMGVWTDTGNISFESTPNRVPTDDVIVSELKKNTFRIVTIMKPPFVQYKFGLENDTTVPLFNRLEGFAIDICKHILANLSITNVSMFFQPDGQYGAQDSNGNWNGIMQTMRQGQADMACVGMSDTDARKEAAKFTMPFLNFQLSILYSKKPENPLDNMFQFMRPFHLYTWLAVIGSVVAMSLVLVVLNKLSRNAGSFGLYETIFLSFASLIQGITGTPPDRPSGQVVIAIYWLFAFVILVAYVTNYAANRTLFRLQADINSLSALHAQSSYTYGTLNGTAYLYMMQNSTDTTQQDIFRYMTSDPVNRLPSNLSAAVDLVKNGSFAFIYESAMNQYFARGICFSENRGKFSTQFATFGLPITAEYESIFNKVITAFINSGERDRLYDTYFSSAASLASNCTSSQFPDVLRNYIPLDPEIFGTKNGALTLQNTLGILVINIVGCVLTLLLAVVECTFFKCKHWVKRHRERKKAKASAAKQKMGIPEDQLESTA